MTPIQQPEGTTAIVVAPSAPTPPRDRRPGHTWSPEEVDALRNGVGRFGRGNWRKIKEAYPVVLFLRTDVDLKDKWRNEESKETGVTSPPE